MRKSELKEIIKSSFLAEAEDSKKGNSEEQKRAEGAIRDNKKHIKKLAADLKFQEEKLAKLKKDSKKDIIKEYDSDITEEKEYVRNLDHVIQIMNRYKGRKLDNGEVITKIQAVNPSDGTNIQVMGVRDLIAQLDRKEKKWYMIMQNLSKDDQAIFTQMGKDVNVDTNESTIAEAEKVDVEVNKILSSGGYDEIDDEELLATVKGRLKGKSNIGAKALNLLIMKIEDEEGGNIDFTNEAKKVDVKDDEEVDIDVEKEVDIEDEETDVEIKTSMPGESGTEQEIQGLLMKAQEEAAKLGDEKLTDQIGNTITYFTRAHISQVDENEDYNSDVEDISVEDPAEDAEVGFALQEVKRFKKLAGIIK